MNQGYPERKRERERETEDLGHSITGTENFHDLPSVRWSPRKADGVV